MKRSPKLTSEQIQKLNAFIREGHRSGREVRRAQAVVLVDQEVEMASITEVTGYRRRQAFELRRKYAMYGVGALKDNRKGTPKELLTKNQRTELITTLKAKRPCDIDTYYEKYDYWTTGVLAEYIKRTYHVAYKSKTSHYVLFRQARFTYHKPGKVSVRQDVEEVQKWRIEAKKQISAVWNDPNTIILTEDEMRLSNQTTVQKIWLPQGEYPRIEIARKREARSIYGFLNLKTGVEHAFKTRWQNMYVTAEIIPQIRKFYPNKHILILWDQAGWHKGSQAQNTIKADGNMETIYFPTAAPEENPQEHVWKSGRSHITHNECMEQIDIATDTFIQYLKTTKFPYSLLGFSARS